MNKKILVVIIVVVIIILFVIYKIYSSYDYNNDNYYLNDITFNISDKYKNSDYSDGYYHYYGDDISCNFSIDYFGTYSYKDGNQYLRDRVSFTLNDKASEVTEVDLNGYKWYYMSVEGATNKGYYYATVRNDKGYVLEYTIRDYLRGDNDKDIDDFCYKEYDKIFSSIKFK